MRQQQQSPTKNTTSATHWLNTLLAENAPANQPTTSVPHDAATIATIDTLRRHIDRTTADATRTSDSISHMADNVQHEVDVWKRAQADELLAILDEDALQQAATLASAHAALTTALITESAVQKPMGNTVMKSKVLDVPTAASIASKLTTMHAAAAQRAAERSYALSQAQGDLRTASKQLAHGRATQTTARHAVAARTTDAMRMRGHAEAMETKAQEYDEACEDLVSAGGFDSEGRSGEGAGAMSHDGVREGVEELKEMEGKLKKVEQALALFHDLPPDVEKCMQLIDDMERQVQQAEVDVQNALSSMSR